MSERPNSVAIRSVIYFGVLDHSINPVVRLIKDKELLHRVIVDSTRDVAEQDRTIVDKDKGTAIALSGPPERALFVAMTIRDAIVRRNKVNEEQLLVHAGISVGPVRVEHINGVPTIQGEGVDVAERVMNLAKTGQMLVSRTYYEITSGLTEEIADMFSPFMDGRNEHGVYAIRAAEEEPFIPEFMAEPAAENPLFSRLLNSENPPRYGMWGGAALAVVAVLATGFTLLSNALQPDLAVVVAHSQPATPAIEVRATPAPVAPSPMASTPSPAPVRQALAPNLIELPEAEPVAAETSAPLPKNELAEKALPETKPKAKKSRVKKSAVKKQATTPAPDTSSQIASVEEKAPEPGGYVPRPEEKKITVAGSGPVVEERAVPPSGSRRPKTIFDDFAKSFKQGRKERVCTQAEITLNQCR
jgi:hypothetical protein